MKAVLGIHTEGFMATATLFLTLSCLQMDSSLCLDPGTRPCDSGILARKERFTHLLLKVPKFLDTRKLGCN